MSPELSEPSRPPLAQRLAEGRWRDDRSLGWAFEASNREGSLPHVRPSGLPGAAASRGGRSPVLAESEASSTQVPEEGVELRRTADAKGDGVLATRPFRGRRDGHGRLPGRGADGQRLARDAG